MLHTNWVSVAPWAVYFVLTGLAAEQVSPLKLAVAAAVLWLRGCVSMVAEQQA